MPDDDPGITLLHTIRDVGLDGESVDSLRERVAAAVAGEIDAEASRRSLRRLAPASRGSRRRLAGGRSSIRRPQLGTVVVTISIFVAIGVGIMALALHARKTSTTVSSNGGKTTRQALDRCLRGAFGLESGAAEAVAGSTSPLISSQFAIFRASSSPSSELPALGGLRQDLAHAGARTYDPSRLVMLFRAGAGRTVYAVPATITGPSLLKGCDAALARLPGAEAFIGLQAMQTGSGPGVCLLSAQVESSFRSGPRLPGAAAPRPTKSVEVTAAMCKSAAVLSSYTGAAGYSIGLPGGQIALLRDGITEVRYAFSDGRRVTVDVARNIARLPASLFLQSQLRNAALAGQLRALAKVAPTVVIEASTDGATIARLPRPSQLFTDLAGSLTFLKRSLTVTHTTTTTGANAGSYATTASCSARSHACIAVTVSTKCDSRLHCRISRIIEHYRYVGSRPPAGTTGQSTLPTAPIVARASRLLTPPRAVELVLSGAPQRQVRVLVSATCSGAASGVSGPGQTLEVSVPSRTQIELPTAAKSMHACDVAALITSAQHSTIHAALTTG